MATPPTPPRIAAAPLALLAGATLALGALQAWPREGQPLLLLFPPGRTEDAALLGVLAVPGWDPVALRRLGPFAAAIAAPAALDASGAALRRASGAWLALPALGWGGCDNRGAADTPVS
ncbi:hypothetical protein [Falsiroseomonas sp.]|uniref:hypothetical protein n=1 Tax=Falsiroseomonas sp. TaxID=2870721 RepID=UPI0035665788